MMPINAAFITADGEFVPSNLLEKKAGTNLCGLMPNKELFILI